MGILFNTQPPLRQRSMGLITEKILHTAYHRLCQGGSVCY